MRKFAVLALLLALTGCSANVPTPEITPVNLKYCALADSAGFNDDGLSRSAYAALQQLKVQTGASVMALEVGAKLTAAAGLKRLVAEHCAAIIASGESLVLPALVAAKANSAVKFYAISDTMNTADSAPNFSLLTFNIYQAAYAAGYLAAAESKNSDQIAVLDALKTTNSKKTAKAFNLGVINFNQLNSKSVQVTSVTDMTQVTQDVVFVLAGSSADLGEFSLSKNNPTKIIGFNRDWYTDVRNKAIAANILTSVVRKDANSKIVDAIVNQTGSANFDLANGGVGLSASHEISFPSTFATDLDKIVKDFESGTLKVG